MNRSSGILMNEGKGLIGDHEDLAFGIRPDAVSGKPWLNAWLSTPSALTAMPSLGKTVPALAATRRLEDSTHSLSQLQSCAHGRRLHRAGEFQPGNALPFSGTTLFSQQVARFRCTAVPTSRSPSVQDSLGNGFVRDLGNVEPREPEVKDS